MSDRAPVATGISYGPTAHVRHAQQAVRHAMARAGIERASSVLLYLTPEYAHDPAPALRAAAREANCAQVVGATGAGLLTNEEWLLDSPGAAAMVLGGDMHLDPRGVHDAGSLVISLATPAGVTDRWLRQPVPRIGAIAADTVGQGPFAVWHAARVVPDGEVHVCVRGARAATGVAQGIRALSQPAPVAEVEGYDVLRVGGHSALQGLVRSLPPGVRELERIPLHAIMCGVTFGEPRNAISAGRYRLNHIVAADPEAHSVTLSARLQPGERVFWAVRDRLAAEQDMSSVLRNGRRQLDGDPDFALLFPCIGRGPTFFGSRDWDLELVRERFPGMPTIGFYGNGELAPIGPRASHLFQYSTVIGLFRARRAQAGA